MSAQLPAAAATVLRCQRNPGGAQRFSKIGAPLMAAAMKRANRKHLALLKARLEDADLETS